MPERIYTWTGEQALEALEEQAFATEDELPALIAEHPELLDGEQIRPGDARPWILIGDREPVRHCALPRVRQGDERNASQTYVVAAAIDGKKWGLVPGRRLHIYR